MNTFKATLLASLIFVIGAPAALAAESEVTWTNPEKYRDVKPNDTESRKRFEERTFKNLEKHFAKLAATLPKGGTLKFDVTDVDLAGDVNAGGIQRMRIVDTLYFPRIKFSYEYVDANQNIVVADEINLKDMNFMTGSRLKYRNDSLGYEKKMLDDWFKKTFKEHIVEK